MTEKGDLDGQPPLLGSYTEDDGFSVRVDEPGNHRLVLQMRVPVKSKRPAGLPRAERTLVLELPQTVITTLMLELPAAVKDVRCNDELEKNRVQGKWFFALGRKQSLTLVWREPIAQPGAGPHLSVEGKVTVSLGAADAEVSADLFLEDPRGQTKECQLLLPPQADVKVEPPAGWPYELIGPSPKNPYHLLRFLEPNAEQWKVTALVKLPLPMPGGRLPVGPFLVAGAEKQRGTITIKAPSDAARTQRVIYHRHGDVFQRDPPKDPRIEAVFEYWVPNASKFKAGVARVPLELEIRSERGPLEGAVEQVLKLRPSGDGWEIDLTARLLVKAPYGSGDFIDVLLPRPRPIGAATFAVYPAAGFPAALPWPALELLRGRRQVAWAMPLEFQIGDEGGAGMIEVPPPDARGRCRVPLPQTVGKGYTLTLTGKYVVAAESQRVRVGLPRVLGIAEQGSKVTVQADESLELLDGAPGQEQPVQEKHRYHFAVDETPGFVDVAWRPYRPDFPANALIDVVIHGRTAQVRQRLMVGPPLRPGPSQPSRLGQIELQVPASVKGLAMIQGTGRTELRPERGIVSVTPRGDEQREVILEYDLRLSERPAANEKDGPRTLDLQAVWPQCATHLQAKVRVWCEPGSRVQVGPAAGELWRDRGVEPVKDRDLLPALVLEGDGPELPLRLVLDETAGGGIAALVCERALIEVAGEDDGLSCRARYLIGKVNADAVDVEFPVRLGLCEPKVHLGEHGIAWKPVDGNDKAIRVPLHAPAGTRPLVLEIAYRLPRSTQEGSVFGVATLAPPVFRDPVRIARLRWQLNLPAADVLAVPITPGARPDFRWGRFRCVLAPEPATSNADLEAWLLGTGVAGDARPAGLSFWPAHPTDAQRVFYQTRLAWLILVSGLSVLFFLFLYFLRLARRHHGGGGAVGAGPAGRRTDAARTTAAAAFRRSAGPRGDCADARRVLVSAGPLSPAAGIHLGFHASQGGFVAGAQWQVEQAAA